MLPGGVRLSVAVDGAATGTVSPIIADDALVADSRFNARFPCSVWQQSVAW